MLRCARNDDVEAVARNSGHRAVARMERSAIRDLRAVRQRTPDCASLHPGYETLCCPSGKTPKLPVNTRPRKYSTLPKFGNGVSITATRPKEEGRIAIVTNAGRAAVDAGHIGANSFAGRETVSEDLAHTTGGICVRQNRVVLAPGVCAPSPSGDVAARPGARISHLAGRRGQ